MSLKDYKGNMTEKQRLAEVEYRIRLHRKAIEELKAEVFKPRFDFSYIALIAIIISCIGFIGSRLI